MKILLSFTIALICLTSLLSCKEEHKPKVKYDKVEKKIEVRKDTSTLEVADLPVQFSGSDVLVFPIGDLVVSDVQKGSIDSRSYEEPTSFNISNALENEITGYLRNVKFQKIGNDSLYVLTPKKVAIERITFLKEKKMLVYVLADEDTNQDNIVDASDIKTLYISDNLGQNFTKISAPMQELIDWNYIESKGQLFYRTIEDANKNGAFDKKDKMHYFNINLNKDLQVKEFYPAE